MNVEKEIEHIKNRNARVEVNKKWEQSLTRTLLIAVLTYVVVLGFLLLAQNKVNIYLSACVPVLGFVISRFSLHWARKIWEKIVYKTRQQ